MEGNTTKYDKQQILEQVVSNISESVATTKGREQWFLDQAAAYPTAMESHSDTNRSQNQSMAASSRKSYLNLSEGLRELEAKLALWDDPKAPDIDLYSVVEVTNSQGIQLVVFIVPGQASATVEYQLGDDNKIEIKAVSEMSGLGKALVGKKINDVVRVGPRPMTITYFE